MYFIYLKSKDMLFFTNSIKHLTVFIISFNILIMTKNKTAVYCQEISSSIKSMKYIPSNLTVPSEDVSRIDRSHHNREVESKFFIKANTIIRTGESRALGAKYLNETRLPSNYDCLKWCLETPTCNAAVYEEKNMQSCYMFDCGSPTKPLCKFTTHNFFTSSVLKISQHSYELSQWGKQVQQERENLEQHQSDITSTTPLSEIKIMSTSLIPPVNKEQPGKKGSVCHHYQFQCVNNSECIAIYNVCDGIPQCPDGSDESSELKCPDKVVSEEVPNNKNKIIDVHPTLENKSPILKQEPSPVHPPIPYPGHQNLPSYKKPYEHKEMQHKDYIAMWPGSYSGSPITKTVPQYHHHVEDSDGLGSPFIHKHSQFISANDPHVQNLNRWASDYDQYPSHSTSLEQQYGPYDRIDEQYLSNQIPPDYDAGKTFTGYHQDDIPYWPSQDILQDNSYTVDEFPQPGVQNRNKVIGYPDKDSTYAQQITRTANQYPETKLSMHSKPLLNPNEASDIDDYKLRYPHPRQQQPYIALEESLQQHYSDHPKMKAKSFNSMQNDDDDTLYNNDDLIRASIVNQLPKKLDQIHHQQEHEMKDLNVGMLHPVSKENIHESTEASRDNSFIIAKPTSHSKAIQRTVLDFKMSVAELYQSSSTHTHEANSAILALVLGVAVSCFLIILLACRMKTLRRRMSRKGRSLAHDADYLVNGMYL